MDFRDLVNFIIIRFISPATTLILAAAVVFFLWNIFQVIRNSDNPKELETFKTKAVWGIVAIAVMVSMWGLVNFVLSSARLDYGTITIPALPSGN
jgi:hypothetical protein